MLTLGQLFPGYQIKFLYVDRYGIATERHIVIEEVRSTNKGIRVIGHNIKNKKEVKQFNPDHMYVA